MKTMMKMATTMMMMAMMTTVVGAVVVKGLIPYYNGNDNDNADGNDDKKRVDASLLNVVLSVPALTHFAHRGGHLQKRYLKATCKKI